jgi:hypothetical protein
LETGKLRTIGMGNQHILNTVVTFKVVDDFDVNIDVEVGQYKPVKLDVGKRLPNSNRNQLLKK